MMRKWIGVWLALVVTACVQQAATSLLHEEAAHQEYIKDCQTLLSPAGYPDNQIYPEAVFTQRACKGEGKAVIKMVRAADVTVVDGSGTQTKSKLYADDLRVFVKTSAGMQLIGEMQETNEGLELRLEDAIDLQLRVGRDLDDLKTWEPGDQAPYAKEVIHVFL